MPISTITSSSSPPPMPKRQCREETGYALWLDLPDALTELILERLSLRYYIRFGSVCRKWRSIQRNHRLRFAPRPPPMDEMLPWLIPTSLDHKSPIRCFSGFDSNPSFHGLCVLPNNLSRYPVCLGGWILFLRPKKSMLFLNPISGVQIPLPPVSGILDLPVCAAVSAPPNSQDSILMIIDYECTVFLYQLNSHSSHWTKFELLRDEPDEYIRNNEVIHSAVYCGGKFYCFTYKYRLYAIDPLFPVQHSPQLIEMHNSHLPCLQFSNAYFVEWDGKLLLVFYTFHVSFQVFRADFANNMWVRVESLGDHVLFVDSFSAQMLLAKDGGLMKNCIYYSIWRFDLEPWSLYKIFDLGTDRIICEQQLPDSVETQDRQHFETNDLYWIVPRL